MKCWNRNFFKAINFFQTSPNSFILRFKTEDIELRVEILKLWDQVTNDLMWYIESLILFYFQNSTGIFILKWELKKKNGGVKK